MTWFTYRHVLIITWNLNTELGLSHHTGGIIVDVLRKEGAEDILLVEFTS